MATKSQTDKKGRTEKKTVSILLFPPIAIPPALLLAMFFRPSARGDLLPSYLVAALVLSYLLLCGMFLILRTKGNDQGAVASALMADALLAFFFAAKIGAPPAFGWFGTALLFGGLSMTMTELSPKPVARFAQPTSNILPEGLTRSDTRQILDAIVLPSVLTETDEDGTERVYASNGTFASLLGRSAEGLHKTPFSELLPSSEEGTTFRFVDMEWTPHRTAKGKQALFILTPLAKSDEPPVIETLDALDPETGLYTGHLVQHFARSVVEGCRRYKRKLAVTLFRISFDKGTTIPPNEEVKKTAISAFGRMLSVSVRACDVAFRVKDEEILLFMPDTSQNGAEAAVNRMNDNVKKLAMLECKELAAAKLADATAVFFGEEIGSLDHVVEEVYLAMKRSRM